MENKQTLLIIDHVEENIEILECRLNKNRFHVLTENEGPKVLHALKEHVDMLRSHIAWNK